MILFNFTGLARFYWLPVVEHSKYGNLWYFSIRWLNVEIIVYSKIMATEFIRRINSSDKEYKP